ncbi:hypothetical protein KP509_32G041100 [Ceratopteris richardii]|uniref:Phospholipid-transporting ATPase n=1 Tax=Ceratopteris richardii TaxID=49495 RepID=A0A8T2QUU7_CERRI|nr:hypothetical protein KP509_32G041100 [Ceratopteris richardii]
MLKEAIEDWRRFLQDKEVNNRKVKVHQGDGEFIEREWKLVKVGDIVKVEREQFFPADLILLASNFEDGICYVETMNLDGETNLKLKRSLECTATFEEDNNYKSFTAIVNCEDPNPNLYTFIGNFEFFNDADTLDSHMYPLSPHQILLRDSKLRNTDYIYGAVLYNGRDTKVVQNSTESPSKRSHIELIMDKIIYLLFSLLLTICVIGSFTFGIRTKKEMPTWWYLYPKDVTPAFNSQRAGVAALLHFVTALILYGYIIPISLYVSIEIVKILQAIFINKDNYMFHQETNKFANARTSNLNEELGQVETILSDKTGTLTCNMMEFLKCSIAGVSYGCGMTEVERVAAKRIGKRASELLCLPIQQNELSSENGRQCKPHIKGFNLEDDRLMDGRWKNEPTSETIQLFFRILAVCHTAIPERDPVTGIINYEVESPDEGAFVVAAREFGFEFYKRTQSSVLVNEPDLSNGGLLSREYKVLDLLEFSSARKRMSIIVEDDSGDIFLFCKGADSIIFERLGIQGRTYEKETRKHLADYADAGLRTLVLAYRKLTLEHYKDWSKDFAREKTYIGADRESRLESVAELIERDLILVGATAVEDKLQQGVPECIDKLAQAGIKIWVLTGDKTETAINIGFACSLLRHGMTQIKINLDNDEVQSAEATGDKEHYMKVARKSIAQQISHGMDQVKKNESKNAVYSLIIDGKALNYALEKHLKNELLELAVQCASVICCRVSPKQKALVTRLVKEGSRKTTLGIGDGANDVGMIKEADIGVGISGLEGMQAAMASDFSIAQFRFLERLLLVHGSWCYKRLALMICYFFYKNIAFGLTLFYYEAYTVFSGQPAYNDWYMSLFNCIFTSLPVIALGVFEQDLPADVKVQFPALYQQGAQNKLFGWDRILGWIGNAFTSSLIIFFFVSAILNPQAFQRNGQPSGMEVLGLTTYTCVLFTVSCQIALVMRYFTWIQHIFLWGSILAWYIFLLLYGEISLYISPSAYRVFIEACAPCAMYWVIILIVVVAALAPYFTCLVFQNYISPMDHIIIHEKVRLDSDQDWLSQERKKAVEPTNVGFTARVEALLKHWKEFLLTHHSLSFMGEICNENSEGALECIRHTQP